MRDQVFGIRIGDKQAWKVVVAGKILDDEFTNKADALIALTEKLGAPHAQLLPEGVLDIDIE